MPSRTHTGELLKSSVLVEATRKRRFHTNGSVAHGLVSTLEEAGFGVKTGSGADLDEALVSTVKIYAKVRGTRTKLNDISKVVLSWSHRGWGAKAEGFANE